MKPTSGASSTPRYNPAIMRWFLALAVLAGIADAQRRIPVVIDTDIGDSIDDAFAVALALRSPELDIRLITTVTDDVTSRWRLAYKELGIFERSNIQIAAGASEPLMDPVHHGQSREFEVLTQRDPPPPAAGTSAADAIIQTVLMSPAKITIAAIGPLTNIALALKLNPAIKQNIERIVLMGGAYRTAQSEYNIQRDRIAAAIVFDSGVPITAVGLDVTLQCKLRPQDLDRLRVADDPASRFLMRLLDLSKSETREDYPTLHDPLAIAAMFRPELIETAMGKVEVSIGDPATFGVTRFTSAADLPASAPRNAAVATTVNVPAFLELLIQRLSAGPR
jgi:purine nucleosidase